VWFPVFDATIQNGCLCVVPESHTRGLPLHCPSRPRQVFDLRIPEVIRGSSGIPVEMKRGSALFMHRLTMHSSLRTLSNECAGASICATNRSASRPAATGCRHLSRAAAPIRVRGSTTGAAGPTYGGKYRLRRCQFERAEAPTLDRHRDRMCLRPAYC
jgi:Phytanoyl-CoA dioxygenase (PhyH)